MCPQLDADDIARITSEVIKQLDGRQVNKSTLQEAVKSATVREQAKPQATPQAAPAQPPTERPEPGSRIILASFGLNRPGIVAAVAAVLAENLCSIEDMSQRIMQEFYTLIMIVDMSRCDADFALLSEKLHAVEEKLGVTILIQHEDVFRYMHRV